MSLNAHLIAEALPSGVHKIGGMDCSFIPKSGKRTYGIDWFYNGSASRSEKGLEISVIAIIDVADHQSYTLSVQQTPANLERRAKRPIKGKRKSPSSPRQPLISKEQIERVNKLLEQLPPPP